MRQPIRRTAALLPLAVLATAALLLCAGPAGAQAYRGIYMNHLGVYTSPPKVRGEATLPWNRPGAAAPAEREWVPPVSAAPAEGDAALPWQQPVAAAAARASAWRVTSFSGTGTLLAPVLGGSAFGAASGSTWGGYAGGLSLGWVYGPRLGSSLLFSTRSGVLSFSHGRFGLAARW